MDKPILATDMEVLKKAALAYYVGATTDVRQMASRSFDNLDSDGNERISRMEFLKIVDKGEEEKYGKIFRNMDINGDGSLDFQEFLVLFFLCMSASVPSCDGCQSVLVNIYFSCVECHVMSSSDSFDLCAECYRYKKFSHSHSLFLDNHTLLRSYKTISAGRFQSENSSGVRNLEMVRSESKRDDFIKAVRIGVRAAGIGMNIAQFCTIM